jgi:hypothetical protein
MTQSRLMEDEEETVDFDVDNTLLEKHYWDNILKFVDAPYVKYLYNLVRCIQKLTTGFAGLLFFNKNLYFSIHM